MGTITGWFDVSMYDMGGSIDAQIDAALTALLTAYPMGAILYVPPPPLLTTYTVDAPVTPLPSGVLLMGAGQRATQLTFATPPTVDSCIFQIGEPPGPAQTSGVTIRDLSLVLGALDD